MKMIRMMMKNRSQLPSQFNRENLALFSSQSVDTRETPLKYVTRRIHSQMQDGIKKLNQSESPLEKFLL